MSRKLLNDPLSLIWSNCGHQSNNSQLLCHLRQKFHRTRIIHNIYLKVIFRLNTLTFCCYAAVDVEPRRPNSSLLCMQASMLVSTTLFNNIPNIPTISRQTDNSNMVGLGHIHIVNDWMTGLYVALGGGTGGAVCMGESFILPFYVYYVPTPLPACFFDSIKGKN